MGDRYDENGKLTDGSHTSDHSFVKDLKDKHDRSKDRTAKVVTSIMTAAIWAVISAIGAVIWFAFEQKVN